ncbi:response regulator [Oceanimonas smirnovii]|uniref:response regulator n=1 Tax=Oceanimonas smirnovii TaxID=264574 RepID=UPI00376FA5CC
MDMVTPPHILLIDDKPDELSALVSILRSEKMRLSISDSAKKGYHKALALTPDLIMLDLHMPGMDGFAVCRLLQEAPALRHTPILFLSSANTLKERLNALKLGGVDFISKPYAPEEVLARIHIHLRLSNIAQAPARPDTSAHQDNDELVLKAAIRLLQQDLAAPPSLEELARQLGTHEKRLLKIFREQLGTTVFAFIRELRLAKAKQLLATQTMSIEDIGITVGFSNAANFSTAFKKQEGVSPRAFRNRHQTA